MSRRKSRKRDLQKIQQSLSQVNPNLLIAGGIVGAIGLGAVGLYFWLKNLSPTSKFKEQYDKVFISPTEGFSRWFGKDREGQDTPNWQELLWRIDPQTGERSFDYKGAFVYGMSPIIGLTYLLNKRKEEEQQSIEQNTPIVPPYIKPPPVHIPGLPPGPPGGRD